MDKIEGKHKPQFNHCKNVWTVFHVSLVFGFIFTAYKALECIQSSLNFESGLGTISISLVYGGYVVSSACIGAPVVSILTPKWSIFFGMFSHTLFILANVWPSWWTLPPASLILGIAAGPYWIGQGTYMTTLAVEYSTMTGTAITQVAERFSSIFHVSWGVAGPLGNLIAAVILGMEEEQEKCATINDTFINDPVNSRNTTLDTIDLAIDHTASGKANVTLGGGWNCLDAYSERNLEFCGASHCPNNEAHLEVLEKPSDRLLYILLGVFFLFNITGIVLAGLLSPIDNDKSISVCRHLESSIKLTRRTNMLLLIMPIFYIGVIPGIFYASFTQSFVSCAYGLSMVGYAMVAEGIGFSLASFICGPLATVIPRVFHMILSFTVFAAMGMSWFFWKPVPGQEWVVLLISIIYGAMHGVHRTHIGGLVSSLFPDEPSAAFAHYNTWLGISYCASFAYSSLLCFAVKNYVFIFFTIITAISHLTLEGRLWRRNKLLDRLNRKEEQDRKDMGELMSGSFKHQTESDM